MADGTLLRDGGPAGAEETHCTRGPEEVGRRLVPPVGSPVNPREHEVDVHRVCETGLKLPSWAWAGVLLWGWRLELGTGDADVAQVCGLPTSRARHPSRGRPSAAGCGLGVQAPGSGYRAVVVAATLASFVSEVRRGPPLGQPVPDGRGISGVLPASIPVARSRAGEMTSGQLSGPVSPSFKGALALLWAPVVSGGPSALGVNAVSPSGRG